MLLRICRRSRIPCADSSSVSSSASSSRARFATSGSGGNIFGSTMPLDAGGWGERTMRTLRPAGEQCAPLAFALRHHDLAPQRIGLAVFDEPADGGTDDRRCRRLVVLCELPGAPECFGFFGHDEARIDAEQA